MTFVNNSAHVVNPLAAGPAPTAQTAAPDEGGLSFGDFLDVVNPLQHFPVVSTLYRAITGDQIKTLPKLAGDALYGGALGFAGSLADSMFEKITGKSVGDTVLAEVESLFSSSDTPAQPTAVAANTSAATPDLGDRIVSAISSLFSSSPSDAPTAVASAPAAAPAAASLSTVTIPGQDALLNALAARGASAETAARAADAYRRSLQVLPATHAPLNLIPAN